MSTPRFLQPGGDGFYHCVSRVVERRFAFGPAEKRHFLKWMRKLETFCGVEVITYCLMSNHFHILLRVPDKAAAPRLTAAALRKLLPLVYKDDALLSAEQELDRAVEAGEEALAPLLARYEARRHSLPVFMRELKQRFTRWFNRRHSRKGTLWEECYRSVLVEGGTPALTAVAAYVDLNPVRAGIAENPEDYPWCGYAEACGGGKRARRGLVSILARERAAQRPLAPESEPSSEPAGAEFSETSETSVPPSASERRRAPGWKDFADGYRLYLFETGVELLPDAQTGTEGRRGFRQERVEAERRRGGRLPLAAALRCRTRHFTEAAVFGSEEYVESVFEAYPERFGPKRETGARKLRGIEAGDLRCLRDLQVRGVGE